MSTDASWVGSMPDAYDSGLRDALFEPYAQHVAALAAALSPQRVLEVAAGTGIGTAALFQALPGASITATDLNPSMVAWAAERVPGATWLQADAQRLEFPDASFDLVVCEFGVMFFPDRPVAFAEAARVLVPGGTMLFTVWDGVEGSDVAAAVVDSLSVVLPDNPPSFLVRVPYGYGDPDLIRSDLHAAGLAVESLERVVLRGRATSARAVADGFSLGTPLRFALEESGELLDLARALGDEVTARLGDGPVEGDLAAFVVSARRPAGPPD